MKKLIVFSLLLFSSCEIFSPKPESEPFYCKIDGKAFRPDNGGDIFFEALLAQRDETYNLFYITADDKNRTIHISTKFNDLKDFTTKTYQINEEFKAYCTNGYIRTKDRTLDNDYEGFLGSGYITFTKVDTLRQLVSGTFEFKAKSIYSEEIINITKGQFNNVYFY